MLEIGIEFRDVLVQLVDAGADFVLLGGHAVAFHGHSRPTNDMDVLIRPTGLNAERVYEALNAAGIPLGDFDIHSADFTKQDCFVHIGMPARTFDILNRTHRLDILGSADGVTFEEAIAEGAAFSIDGRRIPVIGISALIRNKRASGRVQDFADLKALADLGGKGA